MVKRCPQGPKKRSKNETTHLHDMYHVHGPLATKGIPVHSVKECLRDGLKQVYKFLWYVCVCMGVGVGVRVWVCRCVCICVCVHVCLLDVA